MNGVTGHDLKSLFSRGPAFIRFTAMRRFLRYFQLLMILTVAASAQQPGLKPLGELKPVDEVLPGLWMQSTPSGSECMTFTADGRLIITRGQNEKIQCRWKCDASMKPWKLDITVVGKDVVGTIYTVFEFPEKDQFRMAAPAVDVEKRPGTELLLKSPLLLKRVSLEKHGGLYQIAEVHLKGLSGTWQGITSGSKGTVTLSADGTFTMSEGGESDRGRFRIDVSKVPCKIDIVSTEGGGPSYGLYELKGDTLKFSRVKRRPEERPADFEGAVEFVRKK
jgi:uncharacterized protein (TIGR03067 family)